MDCREARDLLDSFLGQELLVETNHELMRHLEACPECRVELDARRRLRATLRKAFTTSPALQSRPTFRSEVLANVRAASHRRHRTRLPIWAAVAASLLLVLTAALVFLGRTRVDPDTRAAVGDHQNCAVKFQLAEPPIPLADAAARFDPFLARLQQTPPDRVATAAGPMQVVARHSCVFAGHRYGHVVLKFDDHLVSLLVTAGTKPGSIGNAKATAAHTVDSVAGLRATSFELGSHTAFVVSDLGESQFRRVADALESVSNQLAELASSDGPSVGLHSSPVAVESSR